MPYVYTALINFRFRCSNEYGMLHSGVPVGAGIKAAGKEIRLTKQELVVDVLLTTEYVWRSGRPRPQSDQKEINGLRLFK